jgi:hypothetical protein
MSTRLETLFDEVAENAPSALIVLAQITPLSSHNDALSPTTTVFGGSSRLGEPTRPNDPALKRDGWESRWRQ